MKALVLAAGRGSRLGDETESVNKCMLRLLDRPLVEYSLDGAIEAGASSLVIVVGYRAEDITDHLGSEYRGVPIHYVEQSEQRGVVHAIECARSAIDGSDFMLFLADEFMVNARRQAMREEFQREDLFLVCGFVRVDDRSLITRTWSFLGDDTTRRIHRMVEKPRRPFSDWMGTGNCIMKGSMLDYLDRCPVNAVRGEREMVDLFQCAVDDARLARWFDVADEYVNINTHADIALAEDRWNTHVRG